VFLASQHDGELQIDPEKLASALPINSGRGAQRYPNQKLSFCIGNMNTERPRFIDPLIAAFRFLTFFCQGLTPYI